MDNLSYLLAVFGIVWVGIFAFVLSMANRQKKLQKEISALRELLKEKGLGNQ